MARTWLEEIEEFEEAEVAEIEAAQQGSEPKVLTNVQRRKQEIGPYAHGLESVKLTPKQEIALKLYATGQLKREDMPAYLKLGAYRVRQLINSKAGQQAIADVRGDLEHRFQSQFGKVLDVLEQGLDHPEPSVAIASANMWFKYARAKQVEVKITAEDLIGKIMSGET